jgi:hypothetical protein
MHDEAFAPAVLASFALPEQLARPASLAESVQFTNRSADGMNVRRAAMGRRR